MLCSCWNKYCENLSNFYMVNRNWKCWVVTATYSTRCHKEYTRVTNVLIHSDSWSLFTKASVKQNIFTWIQKLCDNSEERGTTNISYHSRTQRWILIAICSKWTPNKEKPLAIHRTMHIKAICININKHRHKWMGLMKATKLWSFALNAKIRTLI